MKRLKSLLLCGVAIILIGNVASVYAQSDLNIANKEFKGVVERLWDEGSRIRPNLFVSNGKVSISAFIRGTKECTGIDADILLERDSGSGYKEVANFSSSTASSRLNINKSISASSGEYRLTVTAKIHYGNSYITVSETVYS